MFRHMYHRNKHGMHFFLNGWNRHVPGYKLLYRCFMMSGLKCAISHPNDGYMECNAV